MDERHGRIPGHIWEQAKDFFMRVNFSHSTQMKKMEEREEKLSDTVILR